LGANLEIEEAKGFLVVDIGGGTTDIALISLGGIVIGKSIRIGGETFNQNIINYLKEKYEVIIGEGQAENIKTTISSIINKTSQTFVVKGRDIYSGLPKEVIFTSQDLRESLLESLLEIANHLKDIINSAPPDLLGDISNLGLFLGGGGSLIEGIDVFLEKEVKVKVNLIEEPKFSVIRGIGKIIEDFSRYQKILLTF
jgi:rod shape-determining protein MreB